MGSERRQGCPGRDNSSNGRIRRFADTIRYRSLRSAGLVGLVVVVVAVVGLPD